MANANKTKSNGSTLKGLDKTIATLKKILKDPNTNRMNHSTVVGFLGELVVFKKLREEGLNCTLLGKLSGYDIHCDGRRGNRDLMIDVKSSRRKSEFSSKVKEENWGWALNHKNKKRRLTCTHFVCVQFAEDLSTQKFYVIERENLIHFPKGVGQFKGVTKSFVVFGKRNVTGYNKIYENLIEKSKSLLFEDKLVRSISGAGRLSAHLK